MITATEILNEIKRIVNSKNCQYRDWIDDSIFKGERSIYFCMQLFRVSSKGNRIKLFEDGNSFTIQEGEVTLELYEDQILVSRQRFLQSIKDGRIGENLKEIALNG